MKAHPGIRVGFLHFQAVSCCRLGRLWGGDGPRRAVRLDPCVAHPRPTTLLTWPTFSHAWWSRKLLNLGPVRAGHVAACAISARCDSRTLPFPTRAWVACGSLCWPGRAVAQTSHRIVLTWLEYGRVARAVVQPRHRSPIPWLSYGSPSDSCAYRPVARIRRLVGGWAACA
ncbi:hypothetical protein FB565_007913 [Actinoplanes lutulentus]|nr:hypothetical protein [Actinoplanes lutulentus]